MDSTLSNEQLAMVATRAFAKLWMPRSPREALQPFQSFCCELLRSTQIAVPIVMLALLYVHKFKLRFPGLSGGCGSEYRMFVVALMLASKFLEDNTFTTQTWSEVSHLPARELAIMQREFLVALDHRLHVADTEYNAWIARLQTIVVGKGNSIQLTQSPQSAFVPIEVHTPVVDFQVVPRSPKDHEIPSMPSPPAKRMRYAGSYSADAAHVRVRPEAISIPAYSIAQQPQLYTPPASAFGFARSGDFTFNVPAMPAYGQHNGVFFAHPHSASIAQPSARVYGTQAGFLPSLTTFASSAAVPAHHSFSAAASGPASAHIPQMSGFVGRTMSQRPALPSTAAAMAAASAFATQYPSLCYSASNFGPSFGVGGSLPIYNYGA
ncbi:hypothetical protein IW136_001449 [Coemansia sp. RSA 678]|nr:hypothetical protein IW136_001449 [Coemansia sp. RSA 678]